MHMTSRKTFRLVSDFQPCGDQPRAISALVEGLEAGMKYQVLVGVTGSGKTFTMANVIARLGRPALVIAPNKTLAAQLFAEFKGLFPDNAVEYFVSYYDYYQPEAYIPQSDLYIEKDSSKNEFIDRLRHSATTSLLTRRDVIIVASVSCIYGLGSPEEYRRMHLYLRTGDEMTREEIIHRLVSMLYDRNDMDLSRGTFRVRGDVIEIFPSNEEERALRVELFGDEIERLTYIDPVTGKVLARVADALVYPSSHYVTTSSSLERAIRCIKAELRERLEYFYSRNRLVEAQRLEQRTNLDLEMLVELGYCPGIENYARHLSGRGPGEPPATLLDYFPDDLVVFIDESHITIPQLRGMYAGDRSRKQTLVEFGFRLPSALDNRPLRFEEFESAVGQIVCVSATPGPYEMEKARQVVEQIIRPTGLVDPRMEVRPASIQVDDLLEEIRARAEKGERTLVTTLTKRMAEELTEYYGSVGIRVRYLHSDITTVERSRLIRELRAGRFDALIGINLLREGLDIPEVSLVAVLDADKEGFLRSERSLIQTAGRAARNAEGMVILYADRVTDSMKKALEETKRRRRIQQDHNRLHGIVPRTVTKTSEDALTRIYDQEQVPAGEEPDLAPIADPAEIVAKLRSLEEEMKACARRLEFERAAYLRDQIATLKGALESSRASPPHWETSRCRYGARTGHR